ncbi:MAG: penicillin-binding transpeptidase domain-containing protein [Acidimicrobiales bacterium]
MGPSVASVRRSSAATALLIGCSLLSGCSALSGPPPIPSPKPTLSSYLAAWAHRDWSSLAALVDDPPANFRTENARALTTLGATSEAYTAGAVHTNGSHASAQVTEHLVLPVAGAWTVHTAVPMVFIHRHWRVVWTPAVVNPAFGTDGHYEASYTWPARAPILASDGTEISPADPTSVIIGLYGSYIKNAGSLSKSLIAAGATAAETSAAITAATASPTTFQQVFTVSWARYEQLRATLYPIPGVFFQQLGGTGSTPTALVGVVGTLGEITKAELKQLGPPYNATSTVGQGGLEKAYERQLAGSPGLTISAVTSPRPRTVSRVLAAFPAKPGTAVQTTIDPTIEQDAAAALEGAPNEAALVAIQASTGKILAVANSSQGSDLALEGALPPGSTMKVITSTALIGDGLTPESPASCPTTITVDGEVFHNAGGEGPVSNMLGAFTVSCNTAYIGLTMANLNYNSLHSAASIYRLGTPLHVGMPVFDGSVPVNIGQTDLAASAIGQARVVMSPLDLAMVAADIDTSTVRTPWITEGAAAEHASTAPLSATLVSDLHEMMLSVVESGTAAGTGLPPGTYAKTGTAEYGTGNPLPIDAWLMGFNGDIAFAMVVINSPGNGGPTDGPIVARFLDSLGSTG